MCESNVYTLKEGREEILMESVGLRQGSGRYARTAEHFGEETSVKAGLVELHLSAHRIILEPRSS